MPQAADCPDLTQYQHLAAGKLADAAEDALLEHLESCDSCARKLNTLAEQDTLVELIRREQSRGDKPAEGVIGRLVAQMSKLRPDEAWTGSEHAKQQTPASGSASPLVVACSGCGKSLKVKADLAGKKVRCPHCRSAIAVPSIVPLPGEGAPRLLAPGMGEALTLAPTFPPGGRSAAETATDAGAGGSVGANQHLYDFLAPAQSADELGRLGPYRVLKVLGAGGMGVVFQAEDPHLRRIVALKAMLPGLAASDSAKQRFLREAQAAAALKHDHIVTIFQVGEDCGAPYLAMEFLEGESLDDLLKREGKLALADVLRIGREMAEGLAAAHERGLIHRDIKPANVWLEGKKGRVKILDFGLARAATDEAHLTQSGAIVGTPAFMAPEQAQGKTIGPRCDLFSLGCVLYRMATGEAPFRGTDMISTLMAVATETPAPPVSLNLELPNELSDFIMQLLAKEPKERPESAQAVVDALERIAHEALPPKSAKVVRQKTKVLASGAGRRGRGIVVVALAFALIVLAPLGMWLGGVILRVKTADGTLIIEVNEPNPDVFVDGQKVTVAWDKGGKQAEITIKPGTHKLEVKKDGFTVYGEEVEVADGRRRVFVARLNRAGPSPQVETAPVSADKALTIDLGGGVTMQFVRIPAGSFTMGAPKAEAAEQDNEGEHPVRISKDFYLGKYPVTQAQYKAIVGINPSYFCASGGGKDKVAGMDTEQLPVEFVSWQEATTFCAKLTARDPKKRRFRLPTEAEWEYACRGGTRTAYYFGNWLNGTQANCNGARPYGTPTPGLMLGRTTKVGAYEAVAPHPWGLCDMHGNVFQWCQDWYDPGYYSRSTNVDPICADGDQKDHVKRGGSWFNHARYCRSAQRERGTGPNTIGFRVAFAADTSEAKSADALPPRYKNSLGMEFALVPKGKSWLGGGDGKPGHREVEIPDDFYLGVYELTQEEWQKVIGNNPSYFSRTGGGKDQVKDIPDEELKRFPVELVSWNDAQFFVKQLNQRLKESGWLYRLPTEAEWEYACREGPLSRPADSFFSFYLEKPSNTLLPTQANFRETGLKRPCKVGSYPPNRLGLYDMHGNVWEWIDQESPADPKKPAGGLQCVLRGGGWEAVAGYCRAFPSRVEVSFRPPSHRESYRGVRLARVPVGKASKEGTTTLPVAEGFAPLFNGKDLSGLQKWGNANAEWRVEDGVLVGRWNGKDVVGGAVIGTARHDYQNFRFRIETTLCDEWSSSMVFLWHREGEKNLGWWRANIGTATGRDVADTGVIQHGKMRVTPKSPLRFRSHEWFRQEVVVEGKRIRVFVNNVLTTEHELPETPAPGGLGIALSGGATMRIRKIEVKELPAKEAIVPGLWAPPSSKALEALRREQIPPEALKMAGDGDPNKAPASLVGALGEAGPVHTPEVPDEIFSPAFSGDGRWLAFAGTTTILVRDVVTGRVHRVLKGHASLGPWHPPVSVAFSKDSRTLVSASADGTLKLWPMDKAGEPQTLQPKLGEIWSVAISADGRFLAAGGSNGRIHLWKWGQWDTPKEITPVRQKQSGFTCLALSPDGELLAVGRVEDKWDVPIRVYKTTDGKVVFSLTADVKKGPYPLAPTSITFSRDGKYLAGFVSGWKAGVWDAASGTSVADFPAGQFGAVAFSRDGKTLAVAGLTQVALYDVASQKQERVLAAGHGPCRSVAFSPDGTLLAGSCHTGNVHVWDTITWKEKYLERGHLHYVRGLAISPDGDTLLSVGDDDTLRRWDLARPGVNEILHQFLAEDFHSGRTPQGSASVAYCADGRRFVLLVRGNGFVRGKEETAMIAWDAATSKKRWSLPLCPHSIAFSPDSKTLSGYLDGAVRLWDADDGRQVHNFGSVGASTGIAFSKDGKLLAAASQDKEGSVKVWNVASGAEIHSWKDSAMTAAEFRPDSQILATGHSDGTISVWDLSEGKKKRTLRGHAAQVQSLKFTPNGKTLISSGHDGTIRFWNPDWERARHVIALGPASQRLVMDLDPSGEYLFAAGHGPLIYVLRLPRGDDPTPVGKKGP